MNFQKSCKKRLKIGVDLAQICRFERIFARHKITFLQKFLGKSEILLCAKSSAKKRIESYLDSMKLNSDSMKSDFIESSFKFSTIAGFWAAKEATAKALGCGICGDFGFLDVKIKKTKRGAPKLKFSKKIRQKFGIKNAEVSISHDGGNAVAFVLLEIV